MEKVTISAPPSVKIGLTANMKMTNKFNYPDVIFCVSTCQKYEYCKENQHLKFYFDEKSKTNIFHKKCLWTNDCIVNWITEIYPNIFNLMSSSTWVVFHLKTTISYPEDEIRVCSNQERWIIIDRLTSFVIIWLSRVCWN